MSSVIHLVHIVIHRRGERTQSLFKYSAYKTFYAVHHEYLNGPHSNENSPPTQLSRQREPLHDAPRLDGLATPARNPMSMPSTDPQTQPKRSWRRSRWPITLAAAFLLSLTATIYPAITAPATAASLDAHCLGTFARTFSPPVTNTPQTVTETSHYDYNTCAIGPTATGTETATLTLSCIPITAGPATTEILTWNDATGGTSTITWSAPTIVGQTVVFTGTVTAGRHAADTATKVTSGISYIGLVVPCLLGTPVSSTSGLVDSLLLTH